ncbi:inactive glucose-1-phosphate adenylyltransferase small subunit 2, chloroplastic-like isoform X3 [Apium graveolens]|uniref:inactive glucose-1-phosphate adenylyltransferase small subunit 2, chloroplastic-like isoform X3 n=1 Tax=Apium graveolens TaxID=4045 RepID=UPI003D78B3EA
MVVLQLSHPSCSLNFRSKLTCSRRRFFLKFQSNFPPTSLITNSHQPDYPTSLSPPANQSVAAIVFGDAPHSRLYPLTKRRSDGAIPIAGNYRLIDGVVSNCINSDITKIYALTQNNSTSLNSHISRAYSGACLANDGFVEMIAAYQSVDDKGWFQGTADAVRRCLWVLEEYPVVEFLVLPGHHLYKMDYQKLIEAHRENNADITLAVSGSMRYKDPCYLNVRVGRENQVVEFRECQGKTDIQSKDEKSMMVNDNFPSMGIYVINRVLMIKLLRQYFPKANHLRSDVIPGALSLGMKVQAYKFDGYWEDMRSIESFYHANMESTRTTNMAYKDFPLYTLPRYLPPTIVTDAAIKNSIIGDGCILSVISSKNVIHQILIFYNQNCSIKNSILGLRTRVGDRAIIEDSVIMGSDIYQSSIADSKATGLTIPIGIGEGSHIRKAIVDKNSRIGKNVMIVNKDNVEEGGNEVNGYIITAGIVVILKGAVIEDGTIL